MSTHVSCKLFHAGKKYWRAPMPPDNCRFKLADRALAEIYRDLYREVGGEWGWGRAISWDTAQWSSHLSETDVEGQILFVGADAAGWFELRHDEQLNSIEIYYLALRRPFIGRGLGRQLLRHAIGCSYRRDPQRVWLKTSSVDHPLAFPLYLSESFHLINMISIPESRPHAHPLKKQESACM